MNELDRILGGDGETRKILMSMLIILVFIIFPLLVSAHSKYPGVGLGYIAKKTIFTLPFILATLIIMITFRPRSIGGRIVWYFCALLFLGVVFAYTIPANYAGHPGSLPDLSYLLILTALIWRPKSGAGYFGFIVFTGFTSLVYDAGAASLVMIYVVYLSILVILLYAIYDLAQPKRMPVQGTGKNPPKAKFMRQRVKYEKIRNAKPTATYRKGENNMTRLENSENNQSTIAMLGFAGEGKTVFCSVLAHLIPDLSGLEGVKSIIEKGQNIVMNNINSLLFERTFPPQTPIGYNRGIELKLIREKGLRNRVANLKVNDIDGDAFGRLKELNEDEILKFFLYDQRGDKKFGPYSYIPTAKAYSLIVDCSKFAEWTAKQLDYSQLLSFLVKMKKQKVIRDPLSIIFTKADELPLEYRNYRGMELARLMPQFYSYLEYHFDLRKVSAFTVKIEIERDEKGVPIRRDNKYIPKIVSNNGKQSLSYSNKDFVDIVNWMLDLR